MFLSDTGNSAIHFIQQVLGEGRGINLIPLQESSDVFMIALLLELRCLCLKLKYSIDVVRSGAYGPENFDGNEVPVRARPYRSGGTNHAEISGSDMLK